jgi:hypothetical protein
MAVSAMTTFSIPKNKFVMREVSPDVLEIPGVVEFMAFTQKKSTRPISSSIKRVLSNAKSHSSRKVIGARPDANPVEKNDAALCREG